MVKQLSFFKDKGKVKSLQEIFENIFISYDEEKENIKANFDDYLNFISSIKEIISEGYEVQIGNEKYKIISKFIEEKDLTNIIDKFKEKWIIAVDESQHENEITAGSISYRNSLAYGFKLSEKKDERILSILTSMKFVEDDEIKKREIELKTYIQNLLVAIYAVSILIAQNEKVYMVLIDGPLIRMLGPFLTVNFDKKDMENLFQLDRDIDKYIFENKSINMGDEIEINLIDLAKGKLLKKLDENVFKKIINNINRNDKLKKHLNLQKYIPGIIIYFSLLKLLIDMSRKYNFYVVSCVKATERSTEFTRIYFINILLRYLLSLKSQKSKSKLYKAVLNILNKKRLRFPNYNDNILERLLKLGIKDDQIATFALDFSENIANYLEPVEIRRHRSSFRNKEDIIEKWDENLKLENWEFGSTSIEWQKVLLKKTLEEILPPDKYTFLMSYIRTSELKAALRVEFPKYDKEKIKDIIGGVYLFSLPYQYYGIPIFLKYVDELVRIPSKMFKKLSNSFLTEIALNSILEKAEKGEKIDFTDEKIIINEILGIFKRDFFSRGGIKVE